VGIEGFHDGVQQRIIEDWGVGELLFAVVERLLDQVLDSSSLPEITLFTYTSLSLSVVR
jgi:hypothetical protein